jgi:hypothetical protein
MPAPDGPDRGHVGDLEADVTKVSGWWHGTSLAVAGATAALAALAAFWVRGIDRPEWRSLFMAFVFLTIAS